MKDNVCLDKDTEPPDEETEPPGKDPCLSSIPPIISASSSVTLSSLLFPASKKNHRTGPRHEHSGARFTISPRSEAFRKKFFPEVSISDWNDWHWQLGNRIRTREMLSRILRLSRSELGALLNHGTPLPVSVTPYYAGLLDADNPLQALRRTVIPVESECMHARGEDDDPLNEEKDSPVPGLVHRYPDRVLFLVTDFCSTYCRYCTRSRMVGKRSEDCLSRGNWEPALRYIEKNAQIRDVLLSGGDPLTLSNHRLEWLLSRLRRIPHVELIRIGTKVPVVLPQRITPALTRMLKRYHPLWMSIHFTHPDELTPRPGMPAEGSLTLGFPLGSQTVLLAGVNDDVEIMKRLVHGLLQLRVKPYYLYQCDPISGSFHFRTPVQTGLDIIRGLRGHTTGYAVPTYVIDAPGGGGKIPLLPEYVAGREGDSLILTNYEGKAFRYPDCGGSGAGN